MMKRLILIQLELLENYWFCSCLKAFNGSDFYFFLGLVCVFCSNIFVVVYGSRVLSDRFLCKVAWSLDILPLKHNSLRSCDVAALWVCSLTFRWSTVTVRTVKKSFIAYITVPHETKPDLRIQKHVQYLWQYQKNILTVVRRKDFQPKYHYCRSTNPKSTTSSHSR